MRAGRTSGLTGSRRPEQWDWRTGWRDELDAVRPDLLVVVQGVWDFALAARQYHSRYPPGIEWPTAMTGAHVASLTAVVVFGGDALVRRLRHRGHDHQLPPTGRPSS